MSEIKIFEVYIPQLNKKRTARVLLPNGYDENNTKRYPVLYMQDGQNLFDDKSSYCGVSWDIKNIFDKNNTQMIIASLDNGNEDRRFEYLPWISPHAKKYLDIDYDVGGQGDDYSEYFAVDFKNYIDKNYRTKSDFNNTFIAGSSLGAFISLYIMQKYPKTFSKVGCFSLASWEDEENFLNCMQTADFSHNEQFYIYVGGKETSNDKIKNFPQVYKKCSESFEKVLRDKKISLNRIEYFFEPKGTHTESSWRDNFPNFLNWITK